MTDKKGRFITIEGTEGVGKSSNMLFIQQWLEAEGIEVVVSREPGGTPMAEEIRELLLQKREEPVDETAELLLMFAARAQHMRQLIMPALNRGAWVLCDRFTDATYAYQGAGRKLSIEKIQLLESLVQGSLRPDTVFVLDVDVELGLQRAAERSEKDRFELQQVEFFERVRSCYLDRAKNSPDRYLIVDAGRQLIDVQKQISGYLNELLKAK